MEIHPNPVSLFAGTRGENINFLRTQINRILDLELKRRINTYPDDPEFNIPSPDTEVFEKIFSEFLSLSQNHTPFFSQRYLAQMLKDPAITGILGYLSYALLNPNNHAFEGGPVTTMMEMSVTEDLLKLCGYTTGWGHLCSGGSLANMEAVWAVRDARPEGGICFSEASHYSWKRISGMFRLPFWQEIPVDANFRMDLNALEHTLRQKRMSIVVANFGSTGTGSIDDIAGILELKARYGFHLHIDAAYGGFYRTLLFSPEGNIIPATSLIDADQFLYTQLLAVAESDSITIDPHKLGAMGYGSGAILFKDSDLKNVVLNAAPYTYHQQEKPNIGMFSLEGSRPGATAAACYLTYKMLPLHNEGLGKLISLSRTGALSLYKTVTTSTQLKPLHIPDLDIFCFYPKAPSNNVMEINRRALHLYQHFSVEAENPEFILSKFIVPAHIATNILPDLQNPENEAVTVLRTVFIKHWNGMDTSFAERLVNTMERLLVKVS